MKRVQLGWLAGLLVAFAGAAAQANPIVPANDGVGSVVNRVGNQFDITGGTRAGSNLFHSLLKFGLSEQQIANFLSQPTIRNILTRVTGGETSVINGLIKVTGGPSNLYLLNPAGLVFGPNAQLDIPGSFYGTTANAIKVGNGWFGLNTSPSELQRLTGEPSGFAFSSGNQVLNGELAGIIKNEGKLSVPGGERVVLAGGIVVNTGTIETPHGQIVVTASPGGRYVEITPAGSALSFRLPVAEDQALAADNLRPLRLDDIARLATGTVEVGGTLTTASNVVNPNSRIELVGEDVKLVRGVNISTAGTTGLIQVQVNPLVPVDSWVFVDRVSNYEDIVNALAAGNRLVLLNPTDAGVDVVNRALVGQVGIKALHIVGSGNDAQIWFGQNFIDPERLDEYATRLAQWGQYLDKNGGIFFYTCNLAQSAVGKALVDDIARITGRAVSASTDITGSARYNGNWLLEYGTAGNRLPFVVERIADADVKLFDYTVTNASDVGPPTNSLRFALNKANANVDPANNAVTPPHTIKFFFSAATTINLAAGPLPVNNAGAANKQVTITNVGNGEVTIIAQANNQVFEVFPNNTLIIDGGTQGIILQGNGTVGDGGVILVKGEGSLTLTGRVTVKDGQAKNGGGIALLDGTAANKTTLTITGDVQIINNKANVVGGTKFGGGIYAAGANTLITIGGNALIGDGTPGGANLANKGGGIYTKGTLVVGGDAKIDLNKANVGPDNLGGGIFAAPGATVTLQNNAKVINNEAATPGKGGGVFLDSDPVANQFSILTVKDNALVKTNTAVVGGGIFVNSGSLVILQDKAQVSDNRADKDGGGIFAAAGAFLAGPNIPIPTTVKLIGQDVQVTGNKSGVTVVDRGGGGIYLDSTSADKFSTLLVDKAQITGNKALNNGDGGGIYVTKFSQVTLQNGAKVNSNKADNRGGGIFSLADLTIPATVQVNNNQATNQGGGIFIGPDKTLVVEGQINGNEATATIPGSDGGGIFLGLASKLTLKGNAQVNNNSAASRGGGIFAQKDNTVTIEGNAQVNSNTSAQGAGIAVFADSVGSTLTVDANAQVNENTATDKGGGIFAEGSGAGKITKVFLKGSAEVSGNRAASTSDTSGGGIFAGQDTLVTIEGSAKVNNNVAATTGVLKTAKGGGIFADGTAAAKAKLVVQASAQIKGNSATTDGGGIFAGTNSILEVQGNALIDGNRALTGAGGGILTQGPLTVKDGVVISNNVAKTLGGGIAATKTLTLLNNVQVVANKVVGDNGIGGGIAGAGDTTLDNEVKVTGNKVIGVKGTGGGIATQGNLLVQGKVIVSGNLVDGDDGKGGGIAVAGPTAQIKGEVVISSNQVTGKNALGGGIAVAPGSTLTIDGSVVKITGNVVTSPDSESPSAGGGIAAGGPATLKNKVEVTGNKALGPNAVGGGIAAADALTLQNDVLVAGNQATAQGGGIFTTTALTAQDNVLIGKDGDVGAPNTSKQGGGVFVAGGTATLKGSVKVSANTATTQGGGLFANDLTTVNLLDNVKVAANTANQQGGGLFARGGSAVLLDNNAQIIQNQANQQGSGVFVTDNGTSLTLQGSSKVIQNKTTLKGGGIFAQNGSFVTLDKSSQVAENLASQQGAGLFATGAGTVVTTKGSALVTKNVVNQEGGGFFVTENAKLTVTETAQVTENKATKGGGIFSSTDSVVELSGKAQVTNNKARQGGGLYLDKGTAATIKGEVLVSKNGADLTEGLSVGGGLFVTSFIDPDDPIQNRYTTAQVLDDVKITENSAQYGGGIYVSTSFFDTPLPSSTDLQIGGRTLIQGNKSIDGGGIYADLNAVLTLQDKVKVIQNSAVGSGGGVVVWQGAKATVQGTDTIIADNTAVFGGAGILVGGNSTLTVQQNVQISNNQAQFGGGIFAYSFNNKGPAVLLRDNVKVSDNQATDGGGLYADGAQTNVTLQGNVKVVDNKATLAGGGVVAWNKSTVNLLNAVLVSGNKAKFGGGAFVGGLGVLNLGAGAQIVNNTATVSGGGVFNGGGTFNNLGGTVSGNTPNQVAP